MIWILVSVCAIFLVVFLAGKDKKDDIVGGLDIWAVFIGIIVAVVIYSGGNALIGYFVPAEYNVKAEYQLASLRNDLALEGNFFLGTGSIQEEQYIFYCREEEGGWQLDKAKADDSIIYEEARIDGKLVHLAPSLKSLLWST